MAKSVISSAVCMGVRGAWSITPTLSALCEKFRACCTYICMYMKASADVKTQSDANRINAPWLPTTEPATDRERGDVDNVSNGRGCGGGFRWEESGRWTISFNNPGRC